MAMNQFILSAPDDGNNFVTFLESLKVVSEWGKTNKGKSIILTLFTLLEAFCYVEVIKNEIQIDLFKTALPHWNLSEKLRKLKFQKLDS